MRNAVLVVISMISLVSLGQSRAELVLTSADSVDFFLAVDGVAMPDSAQSKFEIATRPGEVLIDIVLSDSTARDLSTNISMEDGFRTGYEITELRTGLALLQVSRELLDPTQAIPEDDVTMFDDSTLFGYDTAAFFYGPAVESAARSLSSVQIAAADQAEFTQLSINLYNGYFEKEKTNESIEFVENHKHSSSNLAHILDMLDYEDNRLIVAKKAYPMLVDPQNFLIVLDYFQLERSKKEIEEFFNAQAK